MTTFTLKRNFAQISLGCRKQENNKVDLQTGKQQFTLSPAAHRGEIGQVNKQIATLITSSEYDPTLVYNPHTHREGESHVLDTVGQRSVPHLGYQGRKSLALHDGPRPSLLVACVFLPPLQSYLPKEERHKNKEYVTQVHNDVPVSFKKCHSGKPTWK